VKVRLVAIDVDGTLARSDGSIASESITELERVRAAGVTVVIATGRPWLVVERTAAEVGHVDHVVCSNGAVVTKWPDGHFERDIYLDNDVAEAVVNRLRDRIPGIGIGFELAKGAKAERGFADRLPPGVPMGPPVADILDVLPRPVRKMMVWHDDYNDRTHHLQIIVQEALEQRAVALTSGLPFIEVSPVGNDKSAALDDLCAQLGISPSEVVAFGDEHNDVGMISWAGMGVAMGNAVDAVKAVANRIGPTNDEHGVARVLAELVP